MLYALKHRIAKWLCPEEIADAYKWRVCYLRLLDLKHWCSEFEDVSGAGDWVLSHVLASSRGENERPPLNSYDISEFRERLRRRGRY